MSALLMVSGSQISQIRFAEASECEPVVGERAGAERNKLFAQQAKSARKKICAQCSGDEHYGRERRF